MSEGLVFLVVFPVGAFAAATALAFWFGRLKTRVGLGLMVAVWLVFTLYMFFGFHTVNGWDALLYLFGLLFLSLPTGLGTVIGGSVGWPRKDDVVNA